jgi:hypothetical protein
MKHLFVSSVADGADATLVQPSDWNAQHIAPVVDHGNLGSDAEFDYADGADHEGVLNANSTFTFTGATSGQAAWMTLALTQDATGSRTVTWPGSVIWPGSITPTLSTAAGDTDVFTFFTYNGGTSWRGVYQSSTPSGGLLAIAKVGRATSGSTNISTSWADIAENSVTLAVTFTTPADGKVLIRLHLGGGTGGGVTLRTRLWDTGAAAAVAGSYNTYVATTSMNHPVVAWYLTLTGSTSYTLRPQVRSGSGTATLFSGPGAADGDTGSIICEVIDAV